MTNDELIEFWAFPSANLNGDALLEPDLLDEEAPEWAWKFLGIVICLTVSLAGWAGLIVAVQHLIQ